MEKGIGIGITLAFTVDFPSIVSGLINPCVVRRRLVYNKWALIGRHWESSPLSASYCAERNPSADRMQEKVNRQKASLFPTAVHL